MARSISLVFPHQLFESHPALEKERPVYLIEDTLFFGDPHASPGRFHQQKILLHRASMKAFQERLEGLGYHVTYLEYDREKPIDILLLSLHREHAFDEMVTADPTDFLLEKRLRRFAEKKEITLTVTETPMFVTPRDWADEHFDSRKRPFMAKFYEEQRKRMGILVDENGEPEGGQWSFDEDNRKSMPKRGLDTPEDLSAPRRKQVDEAEDYVKANFADYPGKIDSFCYAVTTRDAQDWLEQFLEERFVQFGPYEDALSENERTLFHSLLTPALNIGLLTPQEVVDRALEFAGEHEVPINSLEGFLRQIIGWREFMYLMYVRHGVEMRNSNHFNHRREVPETFWTAETGVPPIDLVIGRVLETGYAHHIERLMVLGNFMLLCHFKPEQVCDWFMELFIDAYDWVMVPNVYGMSQFADGGIFTTKPYISGSNYVKKMSDYSIGEWCKSWDGLFWNFIDRHLEFFKSQHRLGMMVATYNRMDSEKRERHLKEAERFLKSL
ncbi:MAG: cryptochrome/photolyase family protein [Verrucomicrobiales bacterium]|nr:cryptochrome/photolyase family protein [Verrucomicrobiales bacterium]